jgi:predicted lactoylglutathione lyase
MRIEGLTPILNVSSLKESFSWFEKLGWQKHWDWGDPPSFGAVISGKCEIFLCQDCQGARSTAKSRPAGDNEGVWMSWWLESPQAVDDFHRLAIAQGAAVITAPADMPWNVREFELRHPDGHTFRVSAGIPEK